MGRLEYEPVIHHFSHPHPLELSNLQQALAPPACAGCMLGASGWAYTCRTCASYYLHITCAKMPQFIHHPADPSHTLSLLPVPIYPEGSFHCDACGRPGSGFSYHCGDCGLDLHTLCASMPLSVTHHAHPHPLALAFSHSYGSNAFSCDICGGVGSNHWLYRCAACEFDAHMVCATTRQPPQQQPRAVAPVVGLASRSLHWNNPVVGPPIVRRAASSGHGPGGGSLFSHAMEGLVDGASQQVGQTLVQAMFGGGGGGGSGGSGGGNGDLSSTVIGALLGGGGSSGISSS